MFEKEAEEYTENPKSAWKRGMTCVGSVRQAFKDGAEFGYNKAFVEADKNLKAVVADFNKAIEWHSPDEHIDKDRVVLGIIKYCNKTRYSLVQWNGEWWYQYGTFNAEVRLIAWYNIPELKESEQI